LRAHLAQARGLRLAATLGHCLGQVGEDHGEPQPQCDAGREPQRGGGRGRGDGVPDGDQRGEHAADLDDEHHGITEDLAGRELAQALLGGFLEDGAIEERDGLGLRTHD
jgi:hypothetical protein